MTRTIASHNAQDEDDDDVAAGTDTSSHREGKSAEPKPNNHRSKHSETEQRRRSKINERFQILKDIIPPNDQKRDKASLLLEVIEYIRFLQEKLQVYEGTYEQAWNQDPTKMIPWGMKNGSADENNFVQNMTGTQASLEPDFSGDLAYRGANHPGGPAAVVAPFNNPMQSCSYATGGSILPTENLDSQPHLSAIGECSLIGNEGREFESSSTSMSDIYSQGLLKNLTQALHTSGVDLSQANISVQLDVGKREDGGSIAAVASSSEGVGNPPQSSQLGSHPVDFTAMGSVRPFKRLRTGES